MPNPRSSQMRDKKRRGPSGVVDRDDDYRRSDYGDDGEPLSLAEEIAEEARRIQNTPSVASQLTEAELSVLRTVANILHSWAPPAWIKMWERGMDGGEEPS